MNFLKILIKMILALAHSFINTIAEIAWAIAGFFLMTVLITQYDADSSAIEGLRILIKWTMQYWQMFFWTLFVYHFYVSVKELRRLKRRGGD